jgi:hypothetical protein
MKAQRLWLHLTGLLVFGLIPIFARAADESPAPVTDPAAVAMHYRQVLQEEPFQEPVESETGDAWRNWLSDWLTRLGSRFQDLRYAREMPRLASMLTSVLVLAALIGLVYVAARLVRRRTKLVLAGEEATPPRRRLQTPEFYEEELRRAAAVGDWHAAWLASWRQFLSRLETGHLVPADRSRTNREYLAQLRAEPQSAPALALVGDAVEDYDRFIYGRRAIAEPEWRSFQGRLDEAALLLHLRESAAPPAPKSA